MIDRSIFLATFVTIPFSILCLAGCLEPDDRDDITLEEVPQRLTQATCENYNTCYGERWFAKLAGPLEDCEGWLAPQLEDQFTWIYAAVDAGSLTADANHIHRCIEEFEHNAASCSPEPAFTCMDLFVGQLEHGEACERSEQCSPDGYCRISADCIGTCTVIQNEGAPCEVSDQCGLTASCAAGQCAALSELGEACKGEAQTRCKPGYVCQDADGAETAGTCRVPTVTWVLSLGKTCGEATNAYCEPHLSCVYDDAGNQDRGTCQELASPGAACAEAEPDMCVVGEHCVENRCEKLAGLDGSCERSSDCEGRLFCDPSHTCRLSRQVRLGEACESRQECASRICTDGLCSNSRACQPAVGSQ